MVTDENELAATFGDIAPSLFAEHEPEAQLRKIVQVGLDLIEHAHHVGIDLVEGKRIHAVAPSDDVARLVDAIQAEVDEGPCFSAIRQHEVFHSEDLEAETRWPRFAARVYEETGVRSILGFRLFAEEETFGALDLYSERASAFDADAVAIGSVLAAHAAVAMATVREREHLQEALRGRDLIGQAKGILMERGNIGEDEAFHILRHASQPMNVRLRQVAERVIDPTEDIGQG
jgi:GAF domain-containing protein